MSEIFNHLPFFNPDGETFRQLVGDPKSTPKEPVRNINDINSGSIENVVEWHLRVQKRAVHETNFRHARGRFLEEWRRVWGVPGPSGLTDEQYVEYVIDRILSALSTLPALDEILPFTLIAAHEIGFFADVSHINTGPLPDDTERRSAVLTFPHGALYLIIEEKQQLSETMLAALRHAMPAGTAVYVGVSE